MTVQCPKCLTNLQASQASLGKRLKCSACGEIFRAASTSAGAISTNVAAQSTAPTDDDDNDDGVSADDLGLQAPSGAPVSASSTDSSRSVTVAIGFGAIADFAFDRSKIIWALLWGMAWSVLLAVTGMIAQYISPSVALPLVFVATWICYASIIGGISRLTALKLETGSSPPLSDAWELIFKRASSLFAGTITIAMVVLLAATFVLGGIYAVSRIPLAGGVLGGILLIPTFLTILFILSLLLNLYLLPVIIGVEDCSASQAFDILRRLVAKNGFVLFGRYFAVLGSILPFALFSGVLTAGALLGAAILCSGQPLGAAGSGIPAGNIFQTTSALFIVSAWVAFVVVFVTVSIALVYCQSSVRTESRS